MRQLPDNYYETYRIEYALLQRLRVKVTQLMGDRYEVSDYAIDALQAVCNWIDDETVPVNGADMAKIQAICSVEDRVPPQEALGTLQDFCAHMDSEHPDDGRGWII